MTEETEKTPVTIIDRKVTILDKDMTPIRRIGTMARLCYRVERRDGETDDEVDERIIAQCIKSGHESILEHGVFAVYLPMDEVSDSWTIMDKLTGAKGHRVDFRRVWENRRTDSQNKFLSAWNDPEIGIRHANDMGRAPTESENFLPVVVGNARALRQVLREKMFVATSYQDPLELIVVFKVANDLYKQAPVLFQDIIDGINAFLAPGIGETPTSRIDTMLRAKLTVEERNIDGVIAHFFNVPTDIYAYPASSGASLSVIIDTDRSVTHQLVRHRVAVAYSQESQRYVNYDKKGYRHMPFTVDPVKAKSIVVDKSTGIVSENEEGYKVWKEAMDHAFTAYSKLIQLGYPSESARKVLPNDCATRIGVTWTLPAGFSNFMFWRIDKHAQFDIRIMAIDILKTGLTMRHPFFDTINPNVVIKFLEDIKGQHLLDEADVDELIHVQKQRIEKIAEFHEEQRKAMEELAKKREQEAKEKAECPHVGERVIKVAGAEPAPEPEPVVERGPRIDVLPKEG